MIVDRLKFTHSPITNKSVAVVKRLGLCFSITRDSNYDDSTYTVWVDKYDIMGTLYSSPEYFVRKEEVDLYINVAVKRYVRIKYGSTIREDAHPKNKE